MSILKHIIFILSLSYTLSWYSRCDEVGKCTISKTFDSEQIYLVPGYLPLFPEGNIIPVPSPNIDSPSFSVDAIHGFPLYGKLSGYIKYDCANGLSECAFSCCKQGYCAGTVYSCGIQNNTVELIYILTGAIFALFIIIYWVVYFVLGCKYNKYIVKTQKNQQQYGSVVKENQNNPVNHTIEEQSRDEVDEPGMRTHGSIQQEEENDKSNKVDEEKIKRQKLKTVANRLAKLQDNEGNIEHLAQIQEETPKEVPIAQSQFDNQENKPYISQYNDQLKNENEISISSEYGESEQKVKPKTDVNNISDNFDEVNLEDI